MILDEILYVADENGMREKFTAVCFISLFINK
jgi:hypothetical protein